jgi:seryl-tRNA synthetase
MVWDGASLAEPAYDRSSLVLAPAACYHVYPVASSVQAGQGETFEIESWCFRNEAGDGADRLCAFRMREFVKTGDAKTVHRWREEWVERALGFALRLDLEAQVVPASDPFFGAQGKMLAARQRSQELKYELVVPIASRQVAVASMNYHEAHFGDIFEIRLASGEPAHTACAAFGLERFTSALFSRHGPDLDAWPTEVLSALRDPTSGS